MSWLSIVVQLNWHFQDVTSRGKIPNIVIYSPNSSYSPSVSDECQNVLKILSLRTLLVQIIYPSCWRNICHGIIWNCALQMTKWPSHHRAKLIPRTSSFCPPTASEIVNKGAKTNCTFSSKPSPYQKHIRSLPWSLKYSPVEFVQVAVHCGFRHDWTRAFCSRIHHPRNILRTNRPFFQR